MPPIQGARSGISNSLYPSNGAAPAGAARTARTHADTLVYGFIIVIGVMQCALCLRSTDFFRGDTTYFEVARSILSRHWYGFDYQPETVLPPGFPAIMAALCVTLGCTYTLFIRSIAVFSTLGFLAAYAVLRREEGRATGAVICILLISSPLWFIFETRTVFSDLPYLLTSMLTLLLVRRLDAATAPRAKAVTWVLCALALVSSVLIRSAGVALIAALGTWLAISCLTQRGARARRLKLFLPLVLAAASIQGAWMHWAATHETIEWPIGGYPRSYLSQLKVRSGNEPELGLATLAEIPARVVNNSDDRVAGYMTLLTRLGYIDPVWSSPLLICPTLLLIVGVAASMWPRGGSVMEWYFVAHEAIYLAWPWDLEPRFVVPVAPLAGLYIWRGAKVSIAWATRRPRLAAAFIVALSFLAGAHAAAFATRSGSRQLAAATGFWIVLAACAAIVWLDFDRVWTLIDRVRRATIPVPWSPRPASAVIVVCVLAVSSQVLIGAVEQIRLGRENVSFDIRRAPSYPDVEAGTWLHAHTRSDAIVMARQLDVVYHYAQRRVVWFPPISNPRTLMEGIDKYRVGFVVVSQRSSSYWRPGEESCFAALVRAYPTSFRLIETEPRLRIFEVVRGTTQN